MTHPHRIALALLVGALVGAGVAVAAPAAPRAGAKPVAVPSLLDDPRFTRALDPALAKLYNLELAAARAELGRLAAAYPQHPVGPLLTLLPDWWELLLDPTNRSRDARVLAALEQSLARAEVRLDRDDEDLDGRFFKATALAFRGRVKSLRGEWIPAAWDGKRALDLVREVARDQPANEDLYFGLGLYDYFADVMPRRGGPRLNPASLLLLLPLAGNRAGHGGATR